MFATPLASNKMDSYTYDADAEVFDGDANGLDLWVFEHWSNLLNNATLLNGPMQDSKTIHFLHLLALDTHGHAYKPHSSQYLNSIRRVDVGIEKAVAEVGRLFPDGRTAFIFTSDHGMSDKGSHGAGDPTETETPFIAWGAGFRGPRALSKGSPTSPRSWEVDHLDRIDIQQADVAPLIATLLGTALPSNSVGRLPIECLSDEVDRLMALQANAAQMIELLRVKHELRKQASVLWFRPSPALNEAVALLEQSRVSKRLDYADLALNKASSGLYHYDTYDRTFLYCLMSIAMVGWILFMGARADGMESSAGSWWVKWGHGFCLALLWGLLWLDRSPWMYFVYALAAVMIGGEGLKHLQVVTKLPFAWILLVQCLVAGFFWRPVFSVLSIILAIVVPNHQLLYRLGLLACVVFPLIPPLFGSSMWLVVCGGVCCGALVKDRISQVVIVLATVNCIVELRLASWLILVVCLIRFFRFGTPLWDAIVPVFLLLSIAYEPLLLCVIFVLLQQWEIEEASMQSNRSFQRSFMYMFLAYLSFFGTGNTGSLSSFELSSTYRFAVVFNPFLMAALLGLKLMIPVLLVGRVYARVCSNEKDIYALLIMCDVVAFAFFFFVRDQGSWRDIGLR